MGAIEDNLIAQGCPEDVIENGGWYEAPNGNVYNYSPGSIASDPVLVGIEPDGTINYAVNEGDNLPMGVDGVYIENPCGNDGYWVYTANGEPPVPTVSVRHQTYYMRVTIENPYIEKPVTYVMDKLIEVYPLKIYRVQSRVTATPLVSYAMEGITELDVQVTYPITTIVQGIDTHTYHAKAYVQDEVVSTYLAGGLVIKETIPDLERRWPQAFDLYFPFVLGEPYNSASED